MNAVEMRAAFAARELSPVEALEDCARAIAEHEPELNAFITLTLDTAREQALAAERAYAAGTARPLEGIPLAVKDLYDTAGVRTTYGSAVFAGHVPERDADAVALVRAAGAVLVGKTLTHEFAWGITSDNPHFGPARNPYDRERVPGGSSGGSGVALAYGGCALALGSDTGGSIRIPATFCGVSGLKPTYGRISGAGLFPLAPSLDHPGPMARTPADVRLLYEAMAGPVHGEPGVIGVCTDLHLLALEPGIARAFEGAAAALGATHEVAFPGAERIYPAFAAIQMAEAHAVHAKLFAERPDAYGADVRRRLERAAQVTLEDYVAATQVREAVRGRFSALFDEIDVLLTPIAAVAPEPVGAATQAFRDGVLTFTVPQDMAGLPAAAVPVGFDDSGLPVAVQLTGPAGAEGRVLAAAERLYESIGERGMRV